MNFTTSVTTSKNVIKTFLFYVKQRKKIMKLLHHSFEKIAFLFLHTCKKKIKLLKLNKKIQL